MTWQTTNTAKGDNKLYSDARGVVPSLDLRFAAQKNLNDYMTGTPLVDHQRSMSGSNFSPGTFVNSSGLIETAKVNLTTYSEAFDNLARSVTATNCSVSAADVAIAPNGKLAAEKITVTAGPAASTQIRGLTISLTIGKVYTSSFYVKPDGFRYVGIFELNSGTGAGYVVFDLDTDTCVAAYNGAITNQGTSISVGNGWHRISYTYTATGTNNSPRLFIFDSSAGTTATGDGVKGVFVWGAQLEEGSTATTYIPTTTVPSAAPRFDHDPTTGESLGLLIEESRTNLIDYSQAIGPGNDSFSTDASTVTQNAAVSPDGTTTATSISGDVTFAQVTTVGLTTGVEYTFSFYVKTATVTSLRFGVSGIANSIKSVTPNEWNRLSITFTTTTTFASCRFYSSTVLGEPLLVWGAQLELGSFPTSYIPTTGTALTRSADVASITGSNFSSWYNQSEGAVYTKSKKLNPTVTSHLFSFNNGGVSNRILQAPSGFAFLITNSGVIQVNNSSTAWESGTFVESAIGFKVNDFALVTQGSVAATDNLGTIPTVTTLDIGNNHVPNDPFNGHISRLTYWPDRLADSTLQAITAS